MGKVNVNHARFLGSPTQETCGVMEVCGKYIPE